MNYELLGFTVLGIYFFIGTVSSKYENHEIGNDPIALYTMWVIRTSSYFRNCRLIS